MIEEGRWKLVATFGQPVVYQLFDSLTDPKMQNDLSAELDQITFRLIGLLERKLNQPSATDVLPSGTKQSAKNRDK